MYFQRYFENDLILDSVRTSQTQFFHGPGHLEFIEQNLFPEWEQEAFSGSRAQHIRIWSAGSAGGEEAYSLAMTLLERFPDTSGWRIQILATNLSTPARDAGSPPESSEGAHLQDEMPGAGSETGPVIEFHLVNLSDGVYPLGAPFDLILHRNVLTYFNCQSKAGVTDGAPHRKSSARDRSKTRTQ